ncbi:MAG: hypothetical protein D6730_05385 [Bacteroidetes bacterium]|nr:MAG: hypothetical protein D6730_05385 [Bacteroidota bacterium]
MGLNNTVLLNDELGGQIGVEYAELKIGGVDVTDADMWYDVNPAVREVPHGSPNAPIAGTMYKYFYHKRVPCTLFAIGLCGVFSPPPPKKRKPVADALTSQLQTNQYS